MANEATSFRAARGENFRQVLLNVDHFAEAITYCPIEGGDPVPLIATVIERIDPKQEGDVDGVRDVLRVAFSSDPAATNAAGDVLGGVAAPERGDAIYRSGLGDGPEKQYAFEGKVLHRSGHHWELEFVRVELQRVGLNR